LKPRLRFVNVADHSRFLKCHIHKYKQINAELHLKIIEQVFEGSKILISTLNFFKIKFKLNLSFDK
jgi:hypothetical protein